MEALSMLRIAKSLRHVGSTLILRRWPAVLFSIMLNNMFGKVLIIFPQHFRYREQKPILVG